MARRLVAPLRGTPVTPNHLTTVCLILGLGAAWLYAAGDPSHHLGAVLFVAAYFLDHADGELARLTRQTSRFGHYYDLAVDGVVLVAVFIGIGIGQTGRLGGWEPALGMIAGLAIAIIFTLRLELERRLGKAATAAPVRWGVELADVLYLIAPITWLGGIGPFLVLTAIGAPIYALRVLYDCRVLLGSTARSMRP